jgi:hypothetical protein
MSETMAIQELLYEATGQITKTTDFGVRLETSRRTPSPPEGLRFDFEWHAELTGPKVRGKMEGTTYSYTRADGVTFVEWRSVLATPEGDRIAVHSEAVSLREEGTAIFQQRENIRFHTASPRYSWLNRIQGWATNAIDLSTGKFAMKGYYA